MQPYPLTHPLSAHLRDLVRDAVRNHPKAAAVLAGRKVNTFKKDELLIVANTLGVDVFALAATPGTPFVVANPQGFTPVSVPVAVSQDAEPTQDVSAEAADLRRELGRAMVEGDFDGLTTRLEGLITLSRKPAITQTVYVAAPAGTDPALIQVAPVTVPAPVRVDTWAKAFGLKGPMAYRKVNIYAPVPTTPAIDDKYQWPETITQAALAAMGRGRNVWLYGPAGTGKTSFGQQIAARTGRPFVLIPCDDTTEAPELVGMTVPHNGSVRWQDGVLTAAMRVPNAIVLIDEPSVARSGALMVLQSVLAGRMLTVKETGETIRCAPGVVFIAADNTNGTGGGTSEGYEGTRRLNRATLDRFSLTLKLDYMAPEDEARALVNHTGCTKELADVLVECAQLTRKARVTHALGLRRLIAWAECLTDGNDVRSALEFAILNGMAKDDREPTEQACAIGLDRKRIRNALNPSATTAGAFAVDDISTVIPDISAADFE